MALLDDPSAGTDAASQELARMVEERAGLFERPTLGMDTFERKAGDLAAVSELRA